MAIETIRRELVQYGIVLSNSTKEIKEHREEIRRVAKHLLGCLAVHDPAVRESEASKGDGGNE